MTRDRKWVYARDRSQWFNYGFDESTFKVRLSWSVSANPHREGKDEGTAGGLP